MYIIDRFEGNWAVIETDDRQTFHIPRSLLPASAKEGDVISISVVVDSEATKSRRERMAGIMDNFFDQ